MKHLFTFLFLLGISANAWAQKPSVLIVHSCFYNEEVDVQTKLIATNQLSSVDLFDATSATPTLTQLQNYDAVFVFSSYLFQDANALGNVLVSYIEGGKGVVRGVFANDIDTPIRGAFDTDVYKALSNAQQKDDASLTLGTVSDPTHPIMQGVNSFAGGTSSYRVSSTLVDGAVLIASWSDNTPLIAVKNGVGANGARRVDLNFYPVSSSVGRDDYWVASTDGAKIMANALVWASQKAPCPTTTPTLQASNNGVLTCTNPSLTLQAGGGASGATYSFSGPNGFTQSGTGTTASVTQPGEYTVTVSGSNGCPSASKTITVGENKDKPTGVNLNKDGQLTCVKNSVQLSAVTTTKQVVTYQFSGPAVSNVNGNTANATVKGEYTVTVTRTDNGCSTQASTTVEENKTPPQNLQLANGGQLTCTKTSTSLTPSSDTPNPTFVLSGPSLSGSSATGPGQYTVTATNPANGCTAKATTDVSQNTAPPTGVSLSSNGTLSANNPTVTLTASSNATANVGVSYAFSPPAQKQGDNQARVTTSGTYSVTATRSDNGCSRTATTTVLGAASVTACRGTSATLTLAAAGNPTRYEWYIGVAVGQPLRDGAYYQGTATAGLRVVSVSQSQIYYAKVYYADGSSVVYGPYRTTLNTNCGAREAATVEPGTELRITLMGNPLQGEALKAIVNGAQGQRLHVELVDQSGRSMRQQVFEAAESAQVVEWKLNSVSSGLYLLQAVSGQQRHTAKVVKP